MELKDLINYGYRYYLDTNDNFKEIISDENDRNKLRNDISESEINDIKNNNGHFFDNNNEYLQKKWFFSFFNNNQNLHDDDYNNDIGYYDKDEINKNKIFDLLEEILKNKKIYIEKGLDENYILKLIKEKSKHFFPKIIYFFNESINDDEIESELKFLIPEFEKLEDIIINNKDEKFLEYFENDENFNFYFTYQDLYNIDFFYKRICKNNYNYLSEKYQDLYNVDYFCKPFISNILNKLGLKTYNKVIYLNENNYEQKLDENPFKIFKNNDPNYKRVITFYNKIDFILYEPVEIWLNRQKISSKFKNQKKLQNYLSKIIFYENTMNMFFRFKDLKKKELMLSLFMKNKFDIDYESFKFNNGDFKEIYNIINEYIYCEVIKDESNFIDKNLMKSLNDLRSYILPKIINDQNNNDLYLLNFYLNNPKNNKNIIISLLNKYKNIL